MSEKIIQIDIDHRNYLFKLGSDDEVSRLKELSRQLEKRIQQNKRVVATNDYSKILILTCLNLLEEISQNQKKNNDSQTLDDKKLISELTKINLLLKKK